MKTLPQSTIAATVADQFSMNPEEMGVIITRLLSEILMLTHAGHAVSFKGFGSFRPSTRKARVGFNPATGAPVDIPARQVLTFRPAKATARTVADVPNAEGQP